MGIVALACALGLGGTAMGQPGPGVAPQRLASQTAGVIGSGDQLSLKLNTPQGERVLRVGEIYEEGWTLQALTPAIATLARDGETRQVGLNPTGALGSAAPAAPPSTVNIAGVPDEDTVRRIFENAGSTVLEPSAARPGLTMTETRRLAAYSVIIGQEQGRRRAATGGLAPLSPQDISALLGQAAYDDQTALGQKMAAAARAALIADLAARPVTGPNSFYVPAGANAAQIITTQGIDYRGVWDPGPVDAQGGRTFTLTAGTAEQYVSRMATGPAPVRILVPGMPRPQ